MTRTINKYLRRAPAAGAGLVLALGFPFGAAAHVIVWPSTSVRGGYEHYVVYVPAEKAGVPSVGLQLDVPQGVVVDGVEQQGGWTIRTTTSRGRIVAISWTGGSIAPHAYAAFGFAARNPRSGHAVTWRAIQLYADGENVSWAGTPGSATPAAVTTLTSGAAVTAPNAGGLDQAPTMVVTALVAGSIGLVTGVSSLAILLIAIRHRLL